MKLGCFSNEETKGGFLFKKANSPTEVELNSSSQQSKGNLILKEINPEYSLEGLMLMLMLKLQYFGHLLQRADLLEKTLLLGKIESRRKSG